MRVNLTDSGRLGVAVVLLMTAAACGQSSQSPTSPVPFGSSAAVAALSNADVPICNVTAAGTLSGQSQGPCQFNGPGGGRFDCLEHRGGNLNFTRTVTYYDASGVVQSAYDATTTASTKTETSASGSVTTRDGGTATFNRSGVMIVTGLAGAETSRTLNGTETGTVNISGTGFTTNTSITDTTTNLVVPVPRTGKDTPPLSGSRTHSTSSTTTRGSVTHTDTMTRTETFDGTNIVQVVLTINGVTQNCTNDISNHSTTCKR